MPTNNDASIRLAEKHAALLAALLDELARLRRLEAAVEDDGLAGRVAVASGNKCFPTPRCTIEIYRDALLAAIPEVWKGD